MTDEAITNEKRRHAVEVLLSSYTGGTSYRWTETRDGDSLTLTVADEHGRAHGAVDVGVEAERHALNTLLRTALVRVSGYWKVLGDDGRLRTIAEHAATHGERKGLAEERRQMWAT